MAASGYAEGVRLSYRIPLEGVRNSDEAELLSPRRTLFVPLEFVVPACSESCFSIPLLNLHLLCERRHVPVRQVGGGRACGLCVDNGGGEGGCGISAGFAR